MIMLLLSFFLSTELFAAGLVPQSFSAKFEESMISRATGKEKKSNGTIDYKFPGNIRFEVLAPNPTTFVSNAQKSWYYVPPFMAGEQGQVTIQKSSKLPLTKFLDSLKDGIEGSKLFTHQYKGNDLILTFNKSAQAEMGLKEVLLHGKKEAKTIQKLGEFEFVQLLKTDEQKVNLKFIELKEDPSFPPKTFEFTPPAKTKIVNG